MGKVKFPLVNVRRGIDGTWQPVYIEEEIVVPSSTPFVVYLDEVPDDGTLVAPPEISSLVLVPHYPPGDGQFWCNYRQGLLVFHPNQAGQVFVVKYFGKGSLIEVDEINYLHDHLNKRIWVGETPPSAGYLWYRKVADNERLFYFRSGIDRWISVDSFPCYFVRSGNTSSMYLPAIVITASNFGYYFPFPVCVVSIRGYRTNSGTASLRLYNDTTVVGEWDWNGWMLNISTPVVINTPPVLLKLYHSGSSQNPMVYLEVSEVGA